MTKLAHNSIRYKIVLLLVTVMIEIGAYFLCCDCNKMIVGEIILTIIIVNNYDSNHQILLNSRSRIHRYNEIE